jgi:hypothetical protein
MDIKNYQRKTFPVQAVRVTTDNIGEVAEWCKGEVIPSESEPIDYHIKVDVKLPLNERQTKAFPGDYVVLHNGGFKVFQERGFHKSFELVEQDTPLPGLEGGSQTYTASDPHANEPDADVAYADLPRDADPS